MSESTSSSISQQRLHNLNKAYQKMQLVRSNSRQRNQMSSSRQSHASQVISHVTITDQSGDDKRLDLPMIDS